MKTVTGDVTCGTTRKGSVGALPDLETWTLHGQCGPVTGVLGELARTLLQRVRDSEKAWAHQIACALACDVLVARFGFVRWRKR
jgi:hypothetical protein